jgi:hypothetical protein
MAPVTGQRGQTGTHGNEKGLSMSDSNHTPKWLIMVYISADNVLANFAVESLKQLKRAACKDVAVVAQVDANKQGAARRYLFTGNGNLNGSIRQDPMPIGTLPTARGIADPANLTNFINDSLNSPVCAAAKHRCLFLWGHGYELLLDEDQPGKAGANGRNYLTPKNLKQALGAVTQEVSPESAKNTSATSKSGPFTLDIIGIDACAMSLIELATELKGNATYLIASQDDVPDASFPYEELLDKLKAQGALTVPSVCREIPELYSEAYQDYISAPGTGINEITLSSLRLDSVDSVTAPLTELSAALNRSAFNVRLAPKIIKAREASRDFALGMFVDLYDFCEKLGSTIDDTEIVSVCKDVCAAISSTQPAALILKNVCGNTDTSQCHGISIYFPCLAESAIKTVQKSINAQPVPMVDNLPQLAKGGTNHLIKARGLRLGEMETDFAALTEFGKTGWMKFIQQGWSYALATHQPNELDRRYSAEQCSINLAKMVRTQIQPPPPPQGPGSGPTAQSGKENTKTMVQVAGKGD